MKTLIKSSVLIFLVALLSACKSGMVISHGSSFGHCRGFCNKELKLTEKGVKFSAWENGNAPVTKTLEVTDRGTDFKRVAGLLNAEVFKKLELRYGCPDCADGGSEWIEVKDGLNTKRILFEYGNPPEELKALNDQLRSIQAFYDKTK